VVVQVAAVVEQPSAVVVWRAAVVLGLTAGEVDSAAAGREETQAVAGWDWESPAARWGWVSFAAGGVSSGGQEC